MQVKLRASRAFDAARRAARRLVGVPIFRARSTPVSQRRRDQSANDSSEHTSRAFYAVSVRLCFGAGRTERACGAQRACTLGLPNHGAVHARSAKRALGGAPGPVPPHWAGSAHGHLGRRAAKLRPGRTGVGHAGLSVWQMVEGVGISATGRRIFGDRGAASPPGLRDAGLEPARYIVVLPCRAFGAEGCGARSPVARGRRWHVHAVGASRLLARALPHHLVVRVPGWVAFLAGRASMCGDVHVVTRRAIFAVLRRRCGAPHCVLSFGASHHVVAAVLADRGEYGVGEVVAGARAAVRASQGAVCAGGAALALELFRGGPLSAPAAVLVIDVAVPPLGARGAGENARRAYHVGVRVRRRGARVEVAPESPDGLVLTPRAGRVEARGAAHARAALIRHGFAEAPHGAGRAHAVPVEGVGFAARGVRASGVDVRGLAVRVGPDEGDALHGWKHESILHEPRGARRHVQLARRSPLFNLGEVLAHVAVPRGARGPGRDRGGAGGESEEGTTPRTRGANGGT